MTDEITHPDPDPEEVWAGLCERCGGNVAVREAREIGGRLYCVPCSWAIGDDA